jgi:hypothetical protein
LHRGQPPAVRAALKSQRGGALRSWRQYRPS